MYRGIDVNAQHAFGVLADGVRRQILTVLAEQGECSSGEIAQYVGRVRPTTISSHLRVLRAAGAVAERRDGRHRYYSLDPAGPTRDALIFLRELLGLSLRDLGSHAEAGSPPAPRTRGEDIAQAGG
jgi:ArsR family transcriptional regulator, arsenate/arsenite/antimonite-responsive transcriptional repressor